MELELNLTRQISYEYQLCIDMNNVRKETMFDTFKEAKAVYDEKLPLVNAVRGSICIMKVTTMVELEHGDFM